MISSPLSIYINWASYDELSDNVELTEELALRQLDALLWLRMQGVRFDYYLMDAFWYDRDGGYRTWRKPHWPDGPDRWLRKCIENDVKPGLWVTVNTLCQMNSIPEWADSLDENPVPAGHTWAKKFCCFHGGFLAHFMATLDHWHGRGFRLFKFDFADFNAAPPHLQQTLLPSEIRAANITAFQGALKAFRKRHPDVVLIGYNGFEEYPAQLGTAFPLCKIVDHRWLEVFDSLYCGDPRPADVPAMNFWRSKDIYSDHLVRYYEFNGFPLSRIDNSGFMIGTTGTCYHRGTAAWQGMLLLSLARGGWANTYYGNLDLLDEEKARWFARVQRLFLPLQATAHVETFGGMPGEAQPYGYSARQSGGGLFTVVNPSQSVAEIGLPPLDGAAARVLFADAGFNPALRNGRLSLGPEQLAVVGFGSYADARHDLGRQHDVVIPTAIRPLASDVVAGEKRLDITLARPPSAGKVRIVLRQTTSAGYPKRSTGGSPPKGISLGKILRLSAFQAGREIPVAIHYDKAIWSGLSWAVGEVDATALNPALPLMIECSTTEAETVMLAAELFHVFN